MTEKIWIKEFTQCPNCGSEERFCNNIALELKERGLARENFNFYYDERVGGAIDQAKAPMLIIGSTIPGFHICVDVCEDCGTMYVVKLERIEAKAMPAPPGGKAPPTQFGIN